MIDYTLIRHVRGAACFYGIPTGSSINYVPRDYDFDFTDTIFKGIFGEEGAHTVISQEHSKAWQLALLSVLRYSDDHKPIIQRFNSLYDGTNVEEAFILAHFGHKGGSNHLCYSPKLTCTSALHDLRTLQSRKKMTTDVQEGLFHPSRRKKSGVPLTLANKESLYDYR